jgi:N-acetylgalactosamine kinase
MAATIRGERPVSGWINLIKDAGSTFHHKLDHIYGNNSDLKNEAIRMCLCAFGAFAERFGLDRSVLLIRSTGRVNVVGTHIDHRGGSVNPIAVKHIWLVVEPRDDDLVLARNVESELFPDEQFRISQCLPAGRKIRDWDAWCHDEYEKRRHDPTVTWSNYVRAATLYFQHLHTTDDGCFAPAIKGMNMMVYGSVPRAAGLSSSSAIVMLTTEAVLRINGLQVDPAHLAEHCGQAEWYVGTRGGCSDHAAILAGKANALLHITAFPMTVESAALPAGYSFVLANSRIEAKKQAGARDAFNSRVAAYVFGLMLIRKYFPQYAEKLEYLRDVNPEKLGVAQSNILRIVKSLPKSASREEVLRMLPECEHDVGNVFRSHAEPEQGYPIRQVCLYGIAECIRADMVPQCLRTADVKTFGQLINASHDGDRVTRLVDGQRVAVDNSYPDERIDALIRELESGDPERVSRVALWRQSGGYDVSLPEIDALVDIALASPGVIGAGLVGAGMGGCIVAVIEDAQVPVLIENLARQYYRPRNLHMGTQVVTPVGGLRMMDV